MIKLWHFVSHKFKKKEKKGHIVLWLKIMFSRHNFNISLWSNVLKMDDNETNYLRYPLYLALNEMNLKLK